MTQLLMKKNGGVATVGPISLVAGDVLQPVLDSSAGVETWQVDMYSVPDNLPLPAGWTLSVKGFYTWSGPASSNPPAVTWPATGSDNLACFGEVLWQLTINGAAQASDTAMATEAFVGAGFWDIAYQEFGQIFSVKKWVNQYQRTIRILEFLLGAWSPVVTGAGTSTYSKELTDTTAGSFNRTFPASPKDGQRQRYKDATKKWGTNNLNVVGNSGQKVENPAALGTYVAAGTPVALAVNGSSVDWEWSAAVSTWLVVGYVH